MWPSTDQPGVYRDTHAVPLQRAEASPEDIFLAVFGHRPAWMKAVLLARHAVAALAGLEVPTVGEVLRPPVLPRYRVGDKIVAWPIFHLSESELVAGRDNRHLDFRVSVRKAPGESPGRQVAVLATVCTTHNAFGRLYLRAVIPFHRWGVQRLLKNAARAGRL